jgi:myo-inositol 2-dehydrogenase/D-chiro-inositol 1-dehydrogenase
MKPIRIGFIGVGYIAINAHLPGLAPLVEAGQAELRAFCDVDEKNLAEQAATYGVSATYTDYYQMFEKEDLDAVYVCIPPTLHTDQITIAAEKGIAVLVEKPQTLDIGQAVRFDEAIRKGGIVSQVGFQSRYCPSAEKVVDLLQSRTPRHALVQALSSGKPVRYWTSRYELCGGSFVENTIHMVDLLRYFLGDIETVSAFYVARAPDEGPEPMNMPHVYNVNYLFVGGTTANFTLSRVLTNTPTSRRSVQIISDDSLIEWSADRVVENDEVMWKDEVGCHPSFAQTRAFIEAVKAGDPGLVKSSYANALNSLAAVLGANASAERGGQCLALDDLIAGRVVGPPV